MIFLRGMLEYSLARKFSCCGNWFQLCFGGKLRQGRFGRGIGSSRRGRVGEDARFAAMVWSSSRVCPRDVGSLRWCSTNGSDRIAVCGLYTL